MKTKGQHKIIGDTGVDDSLTMIFSFTPIGSMNFIGPLVITQRNSYCHSGCNGRPCGKRAVIGGFRLLSFAVFRNSVPGGMGHLPVIDPVLAFVQRFVPRLLDGIIVGFIAKGTSKVTNNYVSYAVTGFFTAFLNTAFFMSALVLLFGNTDYVKELMGGKNIIVFICTFVGINALVEMAVCTFVTGTVVAALYKARFIPSKNKAQA